MASKAKSDVAAFIEKLSEKTGQSLRPHQIEGVEFMKECWKNGYGCVLADEMGLGKTCQAIVTLSYLLQDESVDDSRSFLIVCPLSVLDHWKKEPEKFGSGLEIIVYRGDKEEREELREQILRKKASWNTILTSYELLMNDSEFFSRFKWAAVVIDEAHRLKNIDSVLHGVLVDEIRRKWILLLTGTPVQNNLNELYSLLSLCHPDEFPAKMLQRFVDRFSDTKNEKAMNKLRQVLKRYILRRTKDVVSLEVPSKSEVILFHDLTDLQKDLYKAILMKNYEIFEQGENKQRLMNTLVQLRKCVGHPYLFEGVEPEPFEQGEHLVAASGKLLILDVLLSFLKKRGHKVLLFSQMTRMLDIIQDYLAYRNHSYERLDGSVRGEERFAAVQRFQKAETFCFLLSTRAGGLGLNLMAADTVIFLDSDFNPQNDLQAAARAHRMGQTKHVKIIRLVGRRTVEEIILARAALKLKFTNTILQEQPEDFARVLTAAEINEMLMFGLSEMDKKGHAKDVSDADLEKLLGKSENGHWMAPEDAEGKDWLDELKMKDIYTFEGKDYREESKLADREALDDLRKHAHETKGIPAGDGKRRPAAAGTPLDKAQKRVMSEEELAELREKRRRAAEKRKLAAKESRLRKEQEEKDRLAKLWKDNDYHPNNLTELTDSENEDGNEEVNFEADDENHAGGDRSSHGDLMQGDPIFVIGDVTKPDLRPEHKKMDVIIVHCVDDSGSWGRGGVFTALSSLAMEIQSHYELAKEMEDLNVGDVHLVEVTRGDANEGTRTFVALIVAQHYKKRNEIKMDVLQDALKRVGIYASKISATVHMPRIGYGMASFNWYGTERMIRKLLCQHGVPTYVYYYPRNQKQRKRARTSESGGESDGSESVNEKGMESDSDKGSESKSVESRDDCETSATKPKRPKVEREPRKKASDQEHSDDVDSNGDLPNLPILFDGYNFLIRGDFSKDYIRRLGRFIIAYGGQMTEDELDNSVTHILVDDSGKDRGSNTSGKPIVSREWLDKCIKEKKLFPID